MKPVIYFDSMEEALKEAANRRASAGAEGLITRIEDSPYGGFKVVSVSAELLVEEATEGFGSGYYRRNPFSQKLAF